MPETKLPAKLSELLRLAVSDAQRCEQDPAVKLDMSLWHEPTEGGPCLLCMAGAVMHCTIGLDAQLRAVPADLGEVTQTRLRAIDCMRDGRLRTAGAFVGVAVSEGQGRDFGAIVEHSFDAGDLRATWETYLRAAEYLEEQGL